MTKTFIIPCVMEVLEPIGDDYRGRVRTQIGPWEFWVARFEDTPDILNRVGVEIDFDKMKQLVEQSGESFDRDKFLKDLTDAVRDALNSLVNGETK